MAKYKIGMIGAGNVAWNLTGSLKGSDYEVVQVINPNRTSSEALAAAFEIEQADFLPAKLRQDLDLVFIVTNDHLIPEIADVYRSYRAPKTIFVHTSGSVHLDALKPLGERTGIIYPMQTFTKNHQADFQTIPVFIEGPDEVLELTRPLAKQLSQKVRYLNSKDRLQLHLGAVFASNFLNFMLMLSEEAVGDVEGLDLKVYEPLVRECIEKAFRYGPKKAQTGPARRGDAVTMQKHLDILHDADPEQRSLYEMLSAMIGKRYGEA